MKAAEALWKAGRVGDQEMVSGREAGRVRRASELNLLESHSVCEGWEVFRKAVGDSDLSSQEAFRLRRGWTPQKGH